MPTARWLLASVLFAWTVPGANAFPQKSVPASSPANDAARAMNEHRYDAAAAAYRELLKAHPDDPSLLANLGMALAIAGHEADSIAPLERALVLNPRLANARMFLGSSYLAIDEVQKAVTTLKQALSQQPSSLEN